MKINELETENKERDEKMREMEEQNRVREKRTRLESRQ